MLDYIRYHFENKITKSSNFIIFLFLVAGLSSLLIVGIQRLIGLDSQLSLFNSWWESITSILSIGSGDTLGERVSSFIYWCLNVTISGSIIAFLTTKLSVFITNLNKGKSQVIDKNHYVIIGWNSNIFKVFEELKAANLNQKTPTILCFNDMNNVEMRAKIDLEYPDQKNMRILTRSGDSYNLAELSIANLDKAKSIIVLFDELKSSYNIETSVLAIRKNIPDGNVPIISEFHDETNMKVLSQLKGKNILGVHTKSIIASVTSQSIRNKHIASVIMDFLDYDGDEIYFYSGAKFVGLSIREISCSLMGATLIGISDSNKKLVLNPAPQKIIMEGDELIVIAEDDDIALSLDESLKKTDTSSLQIKKRENDLYQNRSILIIGWSDLGRKILENTIPMLHEGSNIHITYRTDILNISPSLTIPHEKVQIETSSFDKENFSITKEFLMKNKFDTILIIGYIDHFTNEVADTFSLMQNLQIKTVLEEINSKDRPRVILQLNDGAKKNLIDIDENNEFIVSNTLSSLLMTQLADNQRLQYIFEELFTPFGNEIYIKSINNYLNFNEGDTILISELINLCLNFSENFIGIIQNDILSLNPIKTNEIILTSTIEIVVICES